MISRAGCSIEELEHRVAVRPGVVFEVGDDRLLAAPARFQRRRPPRLRLARHPADANPRSGQGSHDGERLPELRVEDEHVRRGTVFPPRNRCRHRFFSHSCIAGAELTPRARPLTNRLPRDRHFQRIALTARLLPARCVPFVDHSDKDGLRQHLSKTAVLGITRDLRI